MFDQPPFYCPTCGLETHKPLDNNGVEIRYISKDKTGPDYILGLNCCLRCLIGIKKCLDDYIITNRVNRGISLRQMRGQKGCGCGG